MASIATGQLNETGLPNVSKEAHLFNEITVPLPFVNKLCAEELAVMFYSLHATVLKPNQVTIKLDSACVKESS